MIQKPFLGLVTGAKYDYFIFVKIMFKLGFFWSEIKCRLIIWPSVTFKRNISLDIFHEQSLVCTHRAHWLVLNQSFWGIIRFVENFMLINNHIERGSGNKYLLLIVRMKSSLLVCTQPKYKKNFFFDKM